MSDKGYIVWDLTVDTLEEFYKRVALKGAVTEDDKIKILAELASEGKIKRAYATKRSKEQIIKDLQKEHRVIIPGE